MKDDTVGIACDWGTSNLRVYRLGPNAKIIEKRDFSAGITAIKNRKFEDTFMKATQDWLHEYADIPITISGMAGSRQGWIEAPYLPCPTNVLTIANNLTPIRLRSGRIVWLTPGLSYTNSDGLPDVMRGEEVQILGALSTINSEKITICLPGSHSKWATVVGEDVTEFNTYITGELFEAIKSHTIVGAMIDPNSWDEKAFIEGIKFSASTNNILNQLFAVRAKGLFNQLTTATAGAFLSGLLIGHELEAALAGARFRKVYLIGHGQLTNLYHTTLLEKGFDPKILTPDIIANGHFKLMKKIERNVS